MVQITTRLHTVVKFLSFNLAQVPVILHEVLLHSIFQEEMKEMADNPTVLKHLKQQVIFSVFNVLLFRLPSEKGNIEFLSD